MSGIFTKICRLILHELVFNLSPSLLDKYLSEEAMFRTAVVAKNGAHVLFPIHALHMSCCLEIIKQQNNLRHNCYSVLTFPNFLLL
jgi:hypothetical protein